MLTTNTSASGMDQKDSRSLVALLSPLPRCSIDALLPALGIIGKELGAVTANQASITFIKHVVLRLALGQTNMRTLSDASSVAPILFAGFCFIPSGTVICYQADSLGRF